MTRNPRQTAKAPRLAEIAIECGVSVGTVSRALHRPNLVRSDVVKRVQSVAEQLGYRPNPFARSLRGRGSGMFGLIVPDAANPLFAEVASKVGAACLAANRAMVLCYTDRSFEREMDFAKLLVEKRVDGILMFNTSNASGDCIEWLGEQNVPLVLLERRWPGPAVDCVVNDNDGGIKFIVAHLKSLGHTRFGIILDDTNIPNYAERLDAFKSSVQTYNLEIEQENMLFGYYTYSDGYQAAIRIATSQTPPTAIVCGSDTLAIGAIAGLRQIGLRVPEDISVTGYGDIEAASYSTPSLTTINGSKDKIAAVAVKLLVELSSRQLTGEPLPEPKEIILPARLQVRQSTGRAKVAEAAGT